MFQCVCRWYHTNIGKFNMLRKEQTLYCFILNLWIQSLMFITSFYESDTYINMSTQYIQTFIFFFFKIRNDKLTVNGILTSFSAIQKLVVASIMSNSLCLKIKWGAAIRQVNACKYRAWHRLALDRLSVYPRLELVSCGIDLRCIREFVKWPSSWCACKIIRTVYKRQGIWLALNFLHFFSHASIRGRHKPVK